jgi:hypothetical protein
MQHVDADSRTQVENRLAGLPARHQILSHFVRQPQGTVVERIAGFRTSGLPALYTPHHAP